MTLSEKSTVETFVQRTEMGNQKRIERRSPKLHGFPILKDQFKRSSCINVTVLTDANEQNTVEDSLRTLIQEKTRPSVFLVLPDQIPCELNSLLFDVGQKLGIYSTHAL